jgi:hypothetical protein
MRNLKADQVSILVVSRGLKSRQLQMRNRKTKFTQLLASFRRYEMVLGMKMRNDVCSCGILSMTVIMNHLIMTQVAVQMKRTHLKS